MNEDGNVGRKDMVIEVNFPIQSQIAAHRLFKKKGSSFQAFQGKMPHMIQKISYILLNAINLL